MFSKDSSLNSKSKRHRLFIHSCTHLTHGLECLLSTRMSGLCYELKQKDEQPSLRSSKMSWGDVSYIQAEYCVIIPVKVISRVQFWIPKEGYLIQYEKDCCEKLGKGCSSLRKGCCGRRCPSQLRSQVGVRQVPGEGGGVWPKEAAYVT